MANLNALAAKAGEVKLSIDETALGEIADLMLRLHQKSARDAGAILPAAMARTFVQRSESERAGMRSAVAHAIVALTLLGYIEPQEG
jgi:hypothetical protein